MIYEYCLVVGKVYPIFSKLSWETYGYDKPPKNRQVPDTAILTVSRHVNYEAEKVLYSRNTFVMPVLEDMVKFYQRYLRTTRRNALPWIKSVEIAFHSHDLSRTERKAIVRQQYSSLVREVVAMRPERLPDLNDLGPELHESLIEDLTQSAWPSKAKLLTEGLRLHRLRIFLDGAYCIGDCCCLENMAVECLANGFVYGLPDHIELVDVTASGTETEMIIEILRGHRAYQRETGQDSESMGREVAEGDESE